MDDVGLLNGAKGGGGEAGNMLHEEEGGAAGVDGGEEGYGAAEVV